MPLYQFEALDAQGLVQHGSLEAQDTKAAAQVLRARALYVVRLHEPGDGAQGNVTIALRQWWATQGGVRQQHQVMFFKQMAMMLRNGLTILQALDTAAVTVGNAKLAHVVGLLRADIESGASLSIALQRQPKYFSGLLVELVRGAEVSGELDAVMERVAQDMERKSDLQRQLITSMMYPAIVAFSAVGMSLFLVLGVVPKFAEFFAKSGRQLPAVTQNLIDLTVFLQTWGWLMGFALAAAGVSIGVLWRRPESRPHVDRALLRMPVVGNFIVVANMARFTWTAAMLIKSGVTIIETLRVAAGVLGNAAISQDVARATERVLAGADLASSLRQPTLPPMLYQLAAVGERTGALDAVLEDLGSFYQKTLENSIKRMTTLIEPIMILVVAGMVGYVYYAFFAALFAAAG